MISSKILLSYRAIELTDSYYVTVISVGPALRGGEGKQARIISFEA